MRAKGEEGQEKADAVPQMPGFGNFTDKPVLEHAAAVVIDERRRVDKTKADLADFNRQFFASANLKVTSNLLDRENQLVLVRAPRKDRAMDYYKVLTANRESMIDLNTSGFRMFVIHTENYVELFKGKDIEGYGNSSMRFTFGTEAPRELSTMARNRDVGIDQASTASRHPLKGPSAVRAASTLTDISSATSTPRRASSLGRRAVEGNVDCQDCESQGVVTGNLVVGLRR